MSQGCRRVYVRCRRAWKGFVRSTSVLAIAGAALVGGLAPDGGVQVGRDAHATVSVLMTLDELVTSSGRAIVAQPVERYSKWEELGGAKRIVTYTRLVVEETVFGAAKDEKPADIWVRTLGGKVDGIGQHVAGEASFTLGETSLIFLGKAGDANVVIGMAQGHFPLLTAGEDRVLTSSPDTGTLIPRKKTEPPKSARDELLGETLTLARTKILKLKKASK
ncbi:MAG: hypothetical protein HOW73_39935 [Polyangiaceae bacterium]|nr:hypothetical protein [Polyangiaceae bacterium]